MLLTRIYIIRPSASTTLGMGTILDPMIKKNGECYTRWRTNIKNRIYVRKAIGDEEIDWNKIFLIVVGAVMVNRAFQTTCVHAINIYTIACK